MKKIISLFLSVTILVTSFVGFSISANAAGWASGAQKVNFSTWYDGSLDYSGPEDHGACKIVVPARGKVTIKTQGQDDYTYISVYKSNNLDGDEIDPNNENRGYSNSYGNYWWKSEYTLSAGTYYVDFWFYNNHSFDYYITYTPIFSNTKITKLTAKDNAFYTKWTKCSNVSGYQIQYSRNSNMSNSKTKKITNKNTYSSTVKSLKNKKKYYVRIRTYKVVNVDGKKKTYYGKWSAKKAVTTK